MNYNSSDSDLSISYKVGIAMLSVVDQKKERVFILKTRSNGTIIFRRPGFAVSANRESQPTKLLPSTEPAVLRLWSLLCV